MLYLFDLDGTLVSSYMENPDRAYDRWEALPGRRERLGQLLADGHRIAVVTNQAGVAFGHTDERAVWDKVEQALRALGLEPGGVRVYVSFAHPNAKLARYRNPADVARRKPSGAMIREAMEDHPEAAAEGVCYVGDRPEDAAAAKDARVSFRWAHEFWARE